MKEPPSANRRRQDHKPDRLVAHKCSPLRRAPLVFGDLLTIGFDMGFNHGEVTVPLVARVGFP